MHLHIHVSSCLHLQLEAIAVRNAHHAKFLGECGFFFGFLLGYRGDVHPLTAKHRQRDLTNLICAGTTA